MDTGAQATKIAVRGVSKTFRRARSAREVEALRDVSFNVADNTFVTLVGPSGCGKTTLLRLLDGLVLPDQGEILIDGAPPRPGADVGFVFQSFRLMPWRTVRANVGFPLEVDGVAPAERRDRVDSYLDRVGLREFGDAYPNELSGGMKQRAALARALVSEPKILLMDEPFASLDAQTREFMQIELLRLWQRRNSIVVFVTHSVDEAVILSDKIVLMTSRPGRVAEILDVDLPHPRWDDNVRTSSAFADLRHRLWERIREMVAADPESDFSAGPDRAQPPDG